ncbi:MAG: hypothetical protein M1832_002306 [Thelocarpon impressellum]|nr:MAG: hypothetical protein M1832_002306 [Thelocarpon impressellum]
MTDNTTSTLKSYVDSATGAAQSALGSLTGSTADKVQGENRRDEAAAKDDLSHSIGKLGPVNVAPSGAASVDDERRTQGSWDQTVGSTKEAVGGLIGAEGLKQQGARQNQAGKGLEAEGQLSDYGSGVADRAKGAVGGVVAGVTGDREGQERYRAQHDIGKTQERSAEMDIQRQANA